MELSTKAQIITIVPIIIGLIALILRTIVIKQSDFDEKVDLMRINLLQKLASSHSQLMTNFMSSWPNPPTVANPGKPSETFTQYGKDLIWINRVIRKIERYKDNLRRAYIGLIGSVFLSILWLLCYYVLDMDNQLTINVTIFLIIMEMLIVCYMLLLDFRLNRTENDSQ